MEPRISLRQNKYKIKSHVNRLAFDVRLFTLLLIFFRLVLTLPLILAMPDRY